MLRGRNPSYGPVVQLAERVTVNHYVAGSSPAGAASKDMAVIRYFLAGIGTSCYLCPGRLVGLGYETFNLKTRDRSPVGVLGDGGPPKLFSRAGIIPALYAWFG